MPNEESIGKVYTITLLQNFDDEDVQWMYNDTYMHTIYFLIISVYIIDFKHKN